MPHSKSNPLKFFNDQSEARVKALQKAQMGFTVPPPTPPIPRDMFGNPANTGASVSQGASVIRKMVEKKIMDEKWDSPYNETNAETKIRTDIDSARDYKYKHIWDKPVLSKKSGGSIKSKKKY